MREKGLQPAIPPDPAPHITEWLFDIGPVISGGMGMSRIEWRDIRAWQEQIGIPLAPWEARLIRQLSAEYLSMSLDAREDSCPAPYIDQATIEANRGAVARAMTTEAEANAKAAAFLKTKKEGKV